MMRNYFLLFGLLAFCSIALSQAAPQDSLHNLLDQAHDPNIKASILLQIAKKTYEKSHDEYLSYSHKALAETENPNFSNDTLKMKITNNVGCAYSEINDADKANQYFFDAAKIAEQINDQRYLSNLYNNIGLTYGNVHQYDKSIEYHFKSLEIKKDRDDSLGISISYTNVGAVHYSLNDYIKAKEFFEKSFVISKELDDTEGIAFGYTNLADVYYIEGEYEKALEYYQNYLSMVSELGYNHSILYGHKKIGEIHLKLDQLEKANPHIQKAYEMATDYNYTWELTNICLLYAELMNKEGNSQQALVYARQALDYFPTSSSKRKLASIHQTLSDIYKDNGKIDLAYYHLKQNQIEQDSATQQENLETFADMEAKYELNLKDKENLFLKQKQTLNEEIISQRTIVALISTLGAIFLIVIVYWLYKQKENKERLNVVLEKKVEERTIHLRTLNKQFEQTNKEIEEFFYITAHDLKEPLRNIICFSDLAKRSINSSNYNKASEYLTYSERSTSQLRNLFQGIKEFFSIKQQTRKNWMYIDTIIDKAEHQIENTSNSKQANISYQSNIEVSNYLLPEQLSVVIKNLIENGTRFNDNSNPAIEISLEEKPDQFYFTVTDDGIGIPKDYHLKVFEMFECLDSQGKHLGPGLGLAICKKIIKELGGDIRVKESDISVTVIEFWIDKKYCKVGEVRNLAVVEVA